ncbi:hypothetical protein FRC04_011315 [Tulasnella sp. 424]|nr:hypothetical protein FRC04_011315 [Tulasnella sp. 424]KAG8975514.1 hypothetical protein FRC05_005583 [Tulasnella sp. 425]
MPFSTDFEQAVISACDAHERSNRHVVGYRRCLQFGDFFVKFSDYRFVLPAYLTQVYLADVAKAVPEVHVPEVCHFFHRDHLMAYVVMEHIQQIEVSPEELVQKAAQAVSWMRRVPAPPDVVLGPLGSGRARHVVFKNCVAPLDFTSVEALERWFNTAVANVRRFSRIGVEDISIAHERLVLTQSDINAGNFGVDDEGRPCIFDFDEIGWLSESLADYTLLRTTAFAADVAKSLDTRTSPNLASMGRVRSFLVMSSPPCLGLDDDGYLKKRKQAPSYNIEPSSL